MIIIKLIISLKELKAEILHVLQNGPISCLS